MKKKISKLLLIMEQYEECVEDKWTEKGEKQSNITYKMCSLQRRCYYRSDCVVSLKGIKKISRNSLTCPFGF